MIEKIERPFRSTLPTGLRPWPYAGAMPSAPWAHARNGRSLGVRSYPDSPLCIPDLTVGVFRSLVIRPRIGITFANKPIPTDCEYVEAVEHAGGEAIVLRPNSPQAVTSLDGLILSGGEDVAPEYYHEKVEPFCEEIDRDRDEFEFDVLKYFLEHNKPVLAICRGIQTLNVGLGGSLYQDLQHQLDRELLPPHRDRKNLTREEKRAFRHPVTIAQGTKLHSILGGKAEANSRHHQAIKAVAKPLNVTAKSTDDVIEAVESTVHHWVIGVQWHPESREIRSRFDPLFEAFIASCNLKKV